MVRIFFLPYLGNRSKSDPCSYELSCLESHILSFRKLLRIPPESPCMFCCKMTVGKYHKLTKNYAIDYVTEECSIQTD